MSRTRRPYTPVADREAYRAEFAARYPAGSFSPLPRTVAAPVASSNCAPAVFAAVMAITMVTSILVAVVVATGR
jgi:hypothetical protein